MHDFILILSFCFVAAAHFFFCFVVGEGFNKFRIWLLLIPLLFRCLMFFSSHALFFTGVERRAVKSEITISGWGC